MATFYLDFENGNDASAGTSWATAWKTINLGATAARIAPGDEIRVAKTADPTSIGNGTWTNKSATVTLATAQTTSVYLDGAWTLANSATVAANTSIYKQGSNSSQITTPASTATATKYAYYATGTLDLSSYDAITFWFRNNTTAVADANRYVIKLCSDTIGDTAVDEFAIPAIPSTQEWVPLTITRTGGGALGNSIKSIALYTGSSSPGNSQQILIDNVLGCDVDGLNLQSIISKSSSAFTTTETWHGLQSIVGTTVILGNANNNNAGAAALRGYFTAGTSPETVTTYIIKTAKFDMSPDDVTAKQPLQDSGTAGNLITYTGGWDTSSNTQNGYTWVDGINCKGYGLNGASRDYWKVEKIGFVRFRQGINNNGTARTNCQIDNVFILNCFSAGVYEFKYSSSTIIINNCNSSLSFPTLSFSNVNNYYSYNIGASNSISSSDKFNNLKIYNHNADITIGGNCFIKNLTFDNSAAILSINNANGVYVDELIFTNNTGTTGLQNLGKLTINKLTSSNNAALGLSRRQFIVKQTNAISTQLAGNGTDTSTNSLYFSALYNSVNNDSNDNRGYWLYGNALSQTTTRHTASGIAWQINITNANQTVDFPFNFPIAKVAVNASSLVTVKAWVKLSHATDIGAKLLIQNNEIAGVTADVTATKAADTNWEELTITFTPTAAGVAQIYLQGYWLANTADESIYVDDITITQA